MKILLEKAKRDAANSQNSNGATPFGANTPQPKNNEIKIRMRRNTQNATTVKNSGSGTPYGSFKIKNWEIRQKTKPSNSPSMKSL